jgi:hypothetical protein
MSTEKSHFDSIEKEFNAFAKKHGIEACLLIDDGQNILNMGNPKICAILDKMAEGYAKYLLISKTMNDFKPWPEDQPKQRNTGTEDCDMWSGPCVCGAWHKEGK